MNRSQKIVTAASVLVVVGLIALAAPTVANALSAWSLGSAAPKPTATVESPGADPQREDGAAPSPQDDVTIPTEGPGGCTTNAAIHPYGAGDPDARLRGELVDMGASHDAEGAVGYDADGLIETYTVEPGDSLVGIGERFCVDYVTVGSYNDRFGSTEIQPGDVLVLRP